MVISIRSIRNFFLLIIGVLFCIVGCSRDRSHVLMPDDISMHTEVHETFDAEASFEENLMPILTSRCALAGCHVADGPHGLDFRTYESFIAGGEHPAFIPGNAEESNVVEVLVAGIMPPHGPKLSPAEIQIFVDWINHQEPHSDIVTHDEEHDDDMDEDHDDDMDDDHGEIDDDHDDDDGHGDDDDNGHDDHDDN